MRKFTPVRIRKQKRPSSYLIQQATSPQLPRAAASVCAWQDKASHPLKIQVSNPAAGLTTQGCITGPLADGNKAYCGGQTDRE